MNYDESFLPGSRVQRAPFPESVIYRVSLEEQMKMSYYPRSERYPPSSDCIVCGSQFTFDNPCWNSPSCYPDGTYGYGECLRCSEKRS